MKTAWPLVPFLDVAEDVTKEHTKVKQAEYLESGEFPIVDQGQSLIGGYTDDPSVVATDHVPVVVFGDHTRCVKYVDFPFAAGADGTKILRAKSGINPAFLYRVTAAIPVESAGYSRHFKFLKEALVPLPPIEEQRRIAGVLDAADALRAKRRDAIAKLDTLTQAIFIDMFGDPRSNPRRMPTAPLRDLVTFKSGQGLSAQSMRRGRYNVYGGNGVSGTHDEYLFECPQVVVGRVGVYCGAVHLTEPKVWITDNALYVAERSGRVKQGYLAAALRAADLNQYASQAAQPLYESPVVVGFGGRGSTVR